MRHLHLPSAQRAVARRAADTERRRRLAPREAGHGTARHGVACRRAAGAVLAALVVLSLPGCGRVEADDDAARAVGAPTPATQATPPADPAAEASAEPAPSEVPLAPAVTVEAHSEAALVGIGGATLQAGDMAVTFPPDALVEPTAVEIAIVASPDVLGRRLPPSTMLGAYRVTPGNLRIERAPTVVVPLARAVDPGTELELLVWQGPMRAFLVAAKGRADDTGRAASFRPRVLGDMLVRAAPVQAQATSCEGRSLTLHASWPARSEDEVVGLTEIPDRIPRGLAFNLLSDFRLHPAFDRIDFKNEEDTNLAASRADDRDHQDEDFLMDPNAAAALARLTALVEQEWRDPIGGGPAAILRITEAYDSLIEHQARSTHYQGRAVDLTLSPVPPAVGDDRRLWYGRLARLAVCAGFDYVLFEDEYHVHGSVIPTRVALATDDGGTVRVALAHLARPSGAATTRHQFETAPGEVAAIRWETDDDIALLAEAPAVDGGAGGALVDRGRGRPAVVEFEHPAGPGADTVDGLRRIVIQNGQALLVNVGAAPPPGSVDGDGVPVDVVYPFPLSSAGSRTLAAGFLMRSAAYAVARGEQLTQPTAPSASAAPAAVAPR